uniref:ParE toxin of type II toxin-antitoxin system, parDE n=1 Tax=Candidatus Kentrum sp. DK TaxID=2126562 RepID=A0A450TN89_9GAMM|nr:MAG: hypothetical protein BECKDK2373B_GA0170837_12381 [Candidatus Kentron sp. DK]
MKKYKVNLSDAAKDDLHELYDYIVPDRKPSKMPTEARISVTSKRRFFTWGLFFGLYAEPNENFSHSGDMRSIPIPATRFGRLAKSR